ncbi:MAG: GTP-binding protein, partial [Betaproteobacteria bacterium]
MGKYPIKKIRTLALVGQAGSGKTALADALLVQAGALGPEGGGEHGNSTCDYLPIEKRLHHSLKLAVASFETQETRIHLLDTPGYPD